MRNVAFWAVLALLVVALFNLFNGSESALQSTNRSYSDFVTAVDAGSVTQATIDGETVRYRTEDGREFVTILPSSGEITAQVTERLLDNGVPLTARSQEQSGFMTFLLSLLPFLLLI